MHCPNCGTKAEAQQKYCRSCGFGLERVAQLFAEQTAESEAATMLESASVEERLRTVEKWRDRALFVFLTVLLGVVAGYGIIYNLMFLEGQILWGLVALLFLFGAAATLVFVGMVEHLKEEQKRRDLPKAPALPAAETTSKLRLDAPRDPALSVTESTTKSLGELLPERKRSGDLST